MPFYEVTVKVLVEGPPGCVKSVEGLVNDLAGENLVGAHHDIDFDPEEPKLAIVGANVVRGETKTHTKAG